MTAAILVKPDSYAIGPSLYDFTWDEFEKREREREARDADFEEHFELWCRFSYIDREKPKAQEEIAKVMSEALSDLYGNDKDSAAFDQTLFAWFCSSDNAETNNKLHELLNKHIRKAIRKEWERQQEAA